MLDTTHPAPMPESNRKAWQEAYDMWIATQEQFDQENEYDEEVER